MTKITPGTVIHSTLRTDDLLRAFAAELRRVTNHPGDLTLADEADAALRVTDEDYRCEVVASLLDLLNEYAPSGYYFGAHWGDGSDFGWWPLEEEEDEEYYPPDPENIYNLPGIQQSIEEDRK